MYFECFLHPLAALDVGGGQKTILAERLTHKINAVATGQRDLVPPDSHIVRVPQLDAVWVVGRIIWISGAAIGESNSRDA